MFFGFFLWGFYKGVLMENCSHINESLISRSFGRSRGELPVEYQIDLFFHEYFGRNGVNI
jgi:hypothetical protein